MEAPLLVGGKRGALTRYVSEELKLQYVIGDDVVRFVLHERVGFVVHEDLRVVELTGISFEETAALTPVAVRAT